MSAVVRAAFFLAPLIVRQAAYADRQAEDGQLNAALRDQYETKKLIALEPGVIASAHGRAKRDGAVLTLNIARGPAVVLTDDKSGCEPPNFDYAKCYSFRLFADMPSRHAFIVAESHCKGGKVLFIDDRTGARSWFTTIPRFSPDGNILLVIDNDEENGAGSPIVLWNRRDNQKLWEVPASQAAQQTKFIAWDAKGIQLDFWFPAAGNTPERHRLATLANGKSGWAVTLKDGK